MKKNNPKLIITLFSIFVGVLLASQMKLNVELLTPVTVKSILDTKKEIVSVRNEIGELEKIALQKEAKLETLESINTGDANIIDILVADVNDNMNRAGYTKLKGPGIEIIMYDNLGDYTGLNFNDYIIHDVDIMNIINDLRVAGAEAISINDQRIIATSEIKCGGPIIRVNGKSIGTPFVINVIGDPQMLMAAVSAPGTYGDTLMKIYGIGLQPYIKDQVDVPGYSGPFQFNYAKPMEEGE
ncbi:DUF881 domain-containing protein [Gudongella sp. DL1XJH-153]|uniref:DUF881 domain-containing protein n=1 Tax=Gudongella sp. DL1XJH-153 TaxID=3409804 RepID=UPI003BB7ABDE